jgi:protein-L-isoaspartate(D-aspartate) O-methyltransferase
LHDEADMTTDDASARARERMVELHLASRGISDRVLDAFRAVPRECFVPDELREYAYADRPLPIGGRQTISQPYIVARTIDALEVTASDRVLEIGTGSGYAAAVLARVGREVHTVERLESLARTATERLARLGFANVHVRHGDGSLGWPEHAPYDAIAVAAGGPVVPQTLLDQLAVGGRLVMPVSSRTGEGETLLRVRRLSLTEYEEEELEPVHFVPLIGARGHADTHGRVEPMQVAQPGTFRAAARLVREAAEPLEAVDDDRIDALVERLSTARVVLLGESTHGTSEFYRLRARITRKLVERHGFDFVAAEADWPDAERIDAYVRAADLITPTFAWTPFGRFPTWMWRNEEVRAFAEWLREHNAGRTRHGRGVGFHGLDLYSMYTSISFVVTYLKRVDPVAAHRARSRYARLLPWEKAPEGYGLAALAGRIERAEAHVVATLRELLATRLDYARADGERFFDAAQNARVVASAEGYYRAMFHGAAESWNLRDRHMFDTLRLLLAYYGPQSKAIVWAHNSHVGDARATEMLEREELNVGQLCRQAFGDDVRIVGFGTDHGTVLAAREWDEPGEPMVVRPGHPDSYEHVFHESGLPAFVLSLRDAARSAIRDELTPARLFRAIGVVYVPETELESHYLLSVLPEEFDELVWLDDSTAVTPLATVRAPASIDLPETFPFAV